MRVRELQAIGRDFATAKRRKGVGACHLTSAWLLVDAPTIAPIPAA